MFLKLMGLLSDSPLARGSTVIFSLLLPCPAAVTATTQMLYCLLRARLGIR